jgi:integrase
VTLLLYLCHSPKYIAMATLSFKIRKTSDNGGTVQLFFNYGAGRRFRYSTGMKISNIKNWDSRKMRVKNVLAEINKDSFNSKLDEVQTEFNKQYTELILQKEGSINNDDLREIADSLFNKSSGEVQEKKELLPFFKWYLEYYATHPIPTTGKPLNQGTIKTYNNTYTKLVKFNKTKYKLKFDKITLAFYEDFVEWLYKKDYSTNYIGTIIKILKTIMNAAFERELHNNLDFKKRGFKKPTEQIDNIYLNLDELKKFKEADLSPIKLIITESGVRLDREKLERARDLFLISAYTGLRVGDFNRLTKQNFKWRDEIQFLTISTKKTGKKVAVPLHSVVIEILNKRGGHPPQKLPEQHINYAIKIIAEEAKIDDVVTRTITRAGKRVSEN